MDVETSVKLRRTKNQIPLYIGKSINIKERVLSHFAGDVHSPLEMKIAQQVESIETITTAGELGALFLESQLVKSMLPLYNRMLRRKRELIVLTQHKSEDGYYIVKLDTLQEPSLTLLPDTLGFFRSKKQAKDYLSQLAKEYQLCEKLLGLEKTQGACFGQRLDRCKGACISEELPIAYNLRFMTALGKKKIKEWPYKGPLLIHERNEALQITEHFLIDKWCFLGSIKEDDYGSINPTDFSYQFDLDTYKILMRYLSSPNNEKNIQLLNHNKIHSQGRDFRFVE